MDLYAGFFTPTQDNGWLGLRDTERDFELQRWSEAHTQTDESLRFGGLRSGGH